MALKRLQNELSTATKFVNEIAEMVDQMQKTLPTALIIMSKLGGQLSVTRSVLYGVTKRWSAGEVDPQLLQIFNISLPCDKECPIKYAQAMDCSIDPIKRLIIMRFNLKIIQPSTHILMADPFPMVFQNQTTR